MPSTAGSARDVERRVPLDDPVDCMTHPYINADTPAIPSYQSCETVVVMLIEKRL